jgi:hypothetical protein
MIIDKQPTKNVQADPNEEVGPRCAWTRSIAPAVCSDIRF